MARSGFSHIINGLARPQICASRPSSALNERRESRTSPNFTPLGFLVAEKRRFFRSVNLKRKKKWRRRRQERLVDNTFRLFLQLWKQHHRHRTTHNHDNFGTQAFTSQPLAPSLSQPLPSQRTQLAPCTLSLSLLSSASTHLTRRSAARRRAAACGFYLSNEPKSARFRLGLPDLGLGPPQLNPFRSGVPLYTSALLSLLHALHQDGGKRLQLNPRRATRDCAALGLRGSRRRSI